MPVNIGEKLILRCILFSLSLQRCSAHSGHTVIVLLLAWPRVCVCVCVASVSLGRRLAPCCDCVYSFVTLSPALPSTHNWHCRRMERSEGKEETDRGQEQSRLISCSLSLCSLPSLVIGEIRTMSSNQCCHTQIPDLTGSSTGSAGLHRPGSSYCSVREYHSHGALPARAVLRSAKISWTPPPPPRR